MERRILGEEIVTLVDGTKKEVKIYAVKLSEKNQLSRKHRQKVTVGTGKDKTLAVDIHDDKIIEGVLKIAFNGQIEYDDLDFGEDWVYDKYFNPKKIIDKSKKDNTSGSSEVTEDQ